jgi:hypothetical protein
MLQKQQNPHKAGFVRILNGARRRNRTTDTGIFNLIETVFRNVWQNTIAVKTVG